MLSKVPSVLIRVGLRDLRACEAMPEKFQIYMPTWYTPQEDGLCMVCFAGAVIAQSLGNGPLSKDPCDFPEDRDQLNALNEFRNGRLRQAFSYLGLLVPRANCEMEKCDCTLCADMPADLPRSMQIPEHGSRGFYPAMEKMADLLESKGF